MPKSLSRRATCPGARAAHSRASDATVGVCAGESPEALALSTSTTTALSVQQRLPSVLAKATSALLVRTLSLLHREGDRATPDEELLIRYDAAMRAVEAEARQFR